MSKLHIGYKAACKSRKSFCSCFSGERERKLIVQLEVLGETNEKRQCGDPKYAKYRCSRAKVLKIWNPLTGRSYNTAWSWHEYRCKYEVGKIVEPHDYDPDVNKICSGGIHYFLSLERALGFTENHEDDYVKAKFTGKVASSRYGIISTYQDGKRADDQEGVKKRQRVKKRVRIKKKV